MLNAAQHIGQLYDTSEPEVIVDEGIRAERIRRT